MSEIKSYSTPKFIRANLPEDGSASPIQIHRHDVPVFVYANSKLLAEIAPGDTAYFEIEPPKWWEFWKSPRWVQSNPH